MFAKLSSVITPKEQWQSFVKSGVIARYSQVTADLFGDDPVDALTLATRSADRVPRTRKLIPVAGRHEI